MTERDFAGFRYLSLGAAMNFSKAKFQFLDIYIRCSVQIVSFKIFPRRYKYNTLVIVMQRVLRMVQRSMKNPFEEAALSRRIFLFFTKHISPLA